MHCVDRVKSFPTSFYLQKSASMQPRSLDPRNLGENIQYYSPVSLGGDGDGGDSADLPPEGQVEASLREGTATERFDMDEWADAQDELVLLL